jgi:DNA-binding CsgD family transcriptional regulator
MDGVCVGSAAMKLTYMILGHKTEDLLDILKQLAPEIGVDHIAYVRIGSNKSLDSTLLASIVTYPKEWMRRYFIKQYFLIDPVLQYAPDPSLNQFDWEDLLGDNPATTEFFADALRHRVGSNGISIPVRNRKNSHAIVSFSSEMSRSNWQIFKTGNLDTLHHVSTLIDSAAMTGVKIEDPPYPADVKLSLREEQCLIWAARGKTYEEIGEITNISYYSVRSHLDIARHKLHGSNLTHAVALALALGVIPPLALREG